MKTKYSIGPDVIIAIAQQIGSCDFRTTVSLYTTGHDGYPWVITVGENQWRRHLIVEVATIGTSGLDANLALLAKSESDKIGYDIRTNNVEKRFSLKELTEDKYVGVKRMLYPSNRN